MNLPGVKFYDPINPREADFLERTIHWRIFTFRCDPIRLSENKFKMTWEEPCVTLIANYSFMLIIVIRMQKGRITYP